MGNKTVAPAREITEVSLMEEFHWTPQQIAEMPYKKLQKIILIMNQKNIAHQTKSNIEKTKTNFSSRSGQSKRINEFSLNP